MENKRVAGVVVLYNPADGVYDNIFTYLEQVENLFVVDNSTNFNTTLIEKLSAHPAVTYISCNGNKGIGYALNTGAREALNRKFDYLLTMDQDTKLYPGYVLKLVSAAGDRLSDIGIIAPWYKGGERNEEGVQEIPFTMTSANLLNLTSWNKIGGFREDFFIDHVDHEFGLRLNVNGYKVLQVNDVVLDHVPGVTHVWRLFGFRFSYVIHSPERNYYFTRNGFLVSRLYENTNWVFRPQFKKLFRKNLVKALVHNEGRWRRLRLILKGYRDYKKNILGKLNEAGDSK